MSNSFLQKINKPATLKALSVLVTMLIIAYGLFVIGLGSVYAWPNEEALSVAADAKWGGIFGGAKSTLLNFDGRYFTNLLHGFNPLAWGWVEGYKLMPPFGFLLLVLCSAFLMRSFLDITAKKALALAGIFASVHFAVSPSLANELYNSIGSYVYLYGICLWMLWVGALARFTGAKSNTAKCGYFLICAVALIACTGCNEQMLVLNGLTLIFALALFVLYGKQCLPDFVPLLLTGVVSSLFFISCPGLRVRMIAEQQHSYNQLGDIVLLSAGHYLFNLKTLVTQSAFLFPAWCVFGFGYAAKPLFKFEGKNAKTMFGLCCLFWWLATYLIVFAFYLPMGNEASFPDRIYAPVSTLLQILFCVALFFVQPKLVRHNNVVRYLALAWCCAALLFGHNNYTTIWREYRSGAYARFNHIMQQRQHSLKVAQESADKWKRACFGLYEEKETIIYYPVGLNANRAHENRNVALENYFALNEAGFCTDTVTKFKMLLDIIHEN